MAGPLDKPPYTPQPPHGSDVASWAYRELIVLSQVLVKPPGWYLEVVNSPPTRARDGLLAFADGVNWNPGAGKGLYVYSGGWGRILTDPSVGGLVSSTILAGSAISLTSSTPINLTSISLPAGDWDVWLDAYFVTATGTVVTLLSDSVSLVSATLDQTAGNFSSMNFPSLMPGNGSILSMNAGPSRKSLGSTTTVFGVVTANFSAAALTVWGILRARQIK